MSVCAQMTKKVARRNDLERAIPRKQDDLQRQEIAAIVGDQEMRSPLYAGSNDWPVLEITWNLV
jgi:hypothetical protein